ncbi:MAG: metal ABC transporter ATP-binding protein [Planctomycetota bacterium]
MQADHAISIEAVTFGYPGAGHVLARVTIDVRRGERLGVLGPNGGGKSTLMKLIMGFIRPTSGRIDVLGMPPSEARRTGRVGYLAQKVTADLTFPLSVRQVVAMPASQHASPFRATPKKARDAAERALDLVGATSLAERPIAALSGGQLQRVMIARAVVTSPEVLLLDEPTVGIDVEGQRRFGELVDRLRTELDLTVITVTHDLRTVAMTSDRVACLRRTLHYHDAPGGLTPRVLGDVFDHDVEAVFGGHARATEGPARAHD